MPAFIQEDANSSLRAQQAEDIARRVKEVNIESLSKAYDAGRSYTNLLVIAGFAGGFTLWSFCKPILTKEGTVWIGLSFLISLCTFVLFEVFQMIAIVQFNATHRAVLLENVSGAEFLKRHEALLLEANAFQVRVLMRVWRVTLYVTLASALFALALLLYSFVAILTGLPAWP